MCGDTMKSIFLILLLTLCFFCTACSFTNKVTVNAPKYTIQNYNFSGEPQQLNISYVPKRILACGNSSIKTLIALGAEDKIIAAVLTDKYELDYFKQTLPHTKIYTEPLQLEEVIALNPDFILGWRRFFADNQLGDTTTWINKGIPAYIQDASGPIPAKGNFPDCTIASEKQFINNIGKVVHREEQAKQLIQQIDLELQEPTPKKNQKVLFVEFLGGNIEVLGKDMLSGDIIDHYASQLVEYSAPFISQEELMDINADKIFVVYHGGDTEKQLALEQLKNPLYAHLAAVKNGKIYPIAYRSIVAPGADLPHTLNYIKTHLNH